MSHYLNENGTSGNNNTEDANKYLNHRRPTLVSSASSLDSFLMDLPGAPDLFDSMQNALQNDDDEDTIDDTHSADNPTGTTQFMIPSNTVSSSSLHDHQQQRSYLAPHDALQLPNATMTSASDYPQQVPPAPAPAVAVNNTVPEFLYQLTKMLTHDNKEIIEWSNGK